MNGTEQKQRHTAVAAVQTQVDDHAAVLEALDTRIAEIGRLTLDAIDDERAANAKRAYEQHAYTDLRCDAQMDVLRRHVTMTLWQRLRWLLTGRV